MRNLAVLLEWGAGSSIAIICRGALQGYPLVVAVIKYLLVRDVSNANFSKFLTNSAV